VEGRGKREQGKQKISERQERRVQENKSEIVKRRGVKEEKEKMKE
jgi:hypothetical protein